MMINLCITDPACISIGDGCFLAEQSCKRYVICIKERLRKCSTVCHLVIRFLGQLSHLGQLQLVFVRRHESAVVHRASQVNDLTYLTSSSKLQGDKVSNTIFVFKQEVLTYMTITSQVTHVWGQINQTMQTFYNFFFYCHIQWNKN